MCTVPYYVRFSFFLVNIMDPNVITSSQSETVAVEEHCTHRYCFPFPFDVILVCPDSLFCSPTHEREWADTEPQATNTVEVVPNRKKVIRCVCVCLFLLQSVRFSLFFRIPFKDTRFVHLVLRSEFPPLLYTGLSFVLRQNTRDESGHNGTT